MPLTINPINQYHIYRSENKFPFLLESLGPRTPLSKRTILGREAKRRLYCKNGTLYENQIAIGKASDIFKYIQVNKSRNFFPAWIGFFGYEFGQYLGLPTKPSTSDFPDAAFYYYEEGHCWDHGSDLDSTKHSVNLSRDIEASLNKKSFFQCAFDTVIQNIAKGNVYQVNIAQRYSFDAREINFLDLYKRLRVNNPSPFMGLIEEEDWAIACASPERLFEIEGDHISSRPIAGTRPRGKTLKDDISLEYELLASTKERAEHAMLVDLVRNDLARVCDTASVHVDEAFIVERYSQVMHLVSQVSGRLNSSLERVFESLFPAGTITGTPKESAMTHIKQLEPFARGPYTGSMGYISGVGTDFNILIRSAFRSKDTGYIWAGAGIVAESQSISEEDEVSIKARSVSYALRNVPPQTSPNYPRPGVTFPNQKRTIAQDKRVLFIENHDSFSHNIIDAVRRLGCVVDVIDHNLTPDFQDYKHVILGPGPNNPFESGRLMQTLGMAIESNCAILGICLGHQALGAYFGAQIKKAHRAIHGEADIIQHFGHPLFSNIELHFRGMRYHSLVVSDIPQDFEVIALSRSDEVMGIAHKSKPWFGLQFHPESFLSEVGDKIFSNFFEITS